MEDIMVTDRQNIPLVVGVDLGGTQLRASVLRGTNLLSRVNALTRDFPTPDLIISRIFSAIQQALEEAGASLHQIVGIGIGQPGSLDHRTGQVFSFPNLPAWRDVPLQNIFQERYARPTFIDDDANTAALGEFYFGQGRNYKNLVYLTISTGIGGGIIVDGQLMRGAWGTAGELGHMTIDWHGERCSCGNIGCLETIASGTAIAHRARKAIAQGALFVSPDGSIEQQQGEIDAQLVAKAALAGVPEARTILRHAAEALGVGLVNIIHIFNPEIIILGGGLTQMDEALLIEPARHIVDARAMRVPYKDVRIVKSQLGPDAGLIGAGALVYSSVGKLPKSI